MNIKKYVDQILDAFNDNGGYSEIPDDILKITLHEYLEDEYDKELTATLIRVNNAARNGISDYDSYYKEEYAKIKDTIMDKAEALAAFDKKHLP